VNTVSKRFRNIRQAPAAGADLRSPVGVYPDKLPTSVFCFVGELGQERTPSRIADRLRQHTLGQRFDIQILDSNKAVGIHQLPAEFMLEVRPLISDVSMSLLEAEDSLPSPDTALFASGNLPLSTAKASQSLLEVTRVGHKLTIGKCSKRIKPHINADSTHRSYRRPDINNNAKAGIPLAAIMFKGQSLNLTGDRAMHLQFDGADSLNLELPTLGKVASVSPGREGIAIEPVPGLEAGIARFLASLYPAKESFKGLVNPPEHILAGRVVSESEVSRIPNLFELIGLVVVVEADPLHPPRLTPFLESCIIKRAGFRQLMFKSCSLFPVWIKAVFECSALHLFTLLLLNISSYRLFTDVTHSSNIVAARPQGRQFRPQCWEFRAKYMRRVSLKLVNDMLDRLSRFTSDKNVDVVRHNLNRFNLNTKLVYLIVKEFLEPCCHAINQNFAPVFRTPYQVIFDVKYTAWSFLVSSFHRYDYTTGGDICQLGKEGCRNSSVA